MGRFNATGAEVTVEQVFISYARDDKVRVRRLADRLASIVDGVWYDSRLHGGQDWWAEILERIRGCHVFLAVVSRASLASEACRLERSYARDVGRVVLPVAIEPIPATLPHDLASVQIVDVTGEGEEATASLARALIAASDPGPLPEPLPPEPDAPLSYLSDLVDRINSAEELSGSEQRDIVRQLQGGLSSQDEFERAGVRELLLLLARRDDLVKSVERQINHLLDLPNEDREASTSAEAEVGSSAGAPLITEARSSSGRQAGLAVPPGVSVDTYAQPELSGEDAPVRPAGPSSDNGRSTRPWWVAVVLVAVLVGSAIVLWRLLPGDGNSPGDGNGSSTLDMIAPLSGDTFVVEFNDEVVRWNLSEPVDSVESAIAESHNEEFFLPSISSDRRTIAVLERQERVPFLIDADGANLRPMLSSDDAPCPETRRPTWSESEEQHVAVICRSPDRDRASDDMIFVGEPKLDARGSVEVIDDWKEVVPTFDDSVSAEVGELVPAESATWNGDDELILFMSSDPNDVDAVGHIVMVSVSSGTAQVLTGSAGRYESLDASNGRLVYLHRGDAAHEVRLANLDPGSNTRVLLELDPDERAAVTWSPDGKQLMLNAGPRRERVISTFSPEDPEPIFLEGSLGAAGPPAWGSL